jgi:hypothetical protein
VAAVAVAVVSGVSAQLSPAVALRQQSLAFLLELADAANLSAILDDPSLQVGCTQQLQMQPCCGCHWSD